MKLQYPVVLPHTLRDLTSRSSRFFAATQTTLLKWRCQKPARAARNSKVLDAQRLVFDVYVPTSSDRPPFVRPTALNPKPSTIHHSRPGSCNSSCNSPARPRSFSGRNRSLAASSQRLSASRRSSEPAVSVTERSEAE